MFNGEIKTRIVKYLILSALITACSLAEINNLHPFGTASFYSAVFAGANAFILIPSLILGALCAGGGWAGAISVAFAGVVTALVFYVIRKNGKEASVAVMALILFVGQTANVALSWINGVKPLFLAVDLSLCYVFAYVNYCALKPILRHKMKCKEWRKVI